MGRSVLATDEDGDIWDIGNLKAGEWLEGHGPGVAMAMGWLKNKATALFERGKYEEAKAMREMAQEMNVDLQAQLKERVDLHWENHPAIVHDGATLPGDPDDDTD